MKVDFSNYLNLPRKISGTDGTLAKYSYLANGSKTGAENGSGAGLVYCGSLIYKKASNGTLTFDGASIPEGRLLSGATRLYVTDHLGSVKAVVNGNNGNLYEVNNYTVYGKQSANSSASSYISTAPTGEKFRQHFTGKEDQAPDFTVPFTDFGARQYSPALRRWLAPDPLSEKYYGVSPYAYCAGNPVNMVDKDGMFPDIIWDIANVAMDATSLWKNIKEGNTKDAIIDGGGLAVDVIAAFVPFVPGGVGAALKTARSGDKALEASRIIKAGDKAVDAAKASENGARIEKSFSSKKTFQTYIKKNPDTGEVYVGRTSGTGTPTQNVARRDKNHHMNKEGFGPATLDKSSANPDAIRGQEQHMIEKHGGAKSQGGTSGNTINGVSDKNPKKKQYEEARIREFGK